MVKGFSCPKSFGTGEGDKHTFSYCLQDCKNKCMTLPFLAMIIDNVSNDSHGYGNISATALTGCLREVYLSSKEDYYPTPKSMYYTSRGTLMHSILEPIKERIESNQYLQVLDKKRFITEKRFYYSFNREIAGKTHTITVSGQIDSYDIETNTLTDFKSSGDAALPFILNGPKPEHVVQTNIYKFLLESAGYPVDDIIITYFTMMDIINTGSKNVLTKKGQEIEYNVPGVKLIDHEEMRKFIEDKSFILYKAYTLNELPDIPESDELRSWKCGEKGDPKKSYCKARELCPYWVELNNKYEAKTKGE